MVKIVAKMMPERFCNRLGKGKMAQSDVAALAARLRDAYNRFKADDPQTLELFTNDIVYRDPSFTVTMGTRTNFPSNSGSGMSLDGK